MIQINSLIRVEFLRSFWQIKGNPVSILTGVVFFVALFIGILAFSGRSMSINGADIAFFRGTLIRYSFFIIALGILNGLLFAVINEKNSGTLERVRMAGHQLLTFFTAKALINCIFPFIQSTILIYVISLFLKVDIIFSYDLVFLYIFHCLSIIGIGFILSGLALVMKSNFFVLLQFLIFPLLFLNFSFFKYTPVAVNAYLASAKAQGFQIDPSLWAFSIVSSTLLAMFGFYVFKICEKICIKNGALGFG